MITVRALVESALPAARWPPGRPAGGSLAFQRLPFEPEESRRWHRDWQSQPTVRTGAVTKRPKPLCRCKNIESIFASTCSDRGTVTVAADSAGSHCRARAGRGAGGRRPPTQNLNNNYYGPDPARLERAGNDGLQMVIVLELEQ